MRGELAFRSDFFDFGLPSKGVSGPVYDPDAASLFARMSVQPDDVRKLLISDTIAAFKAAGVWSKFDILYFLAAHDAQAARLNWKSNNFNCLAVSSPTFTTDRGYAGNGSSSYLNTQYTPNQTLNPGAQFLQSNCAMGVASRTNFLSASQWDFGTVRSLIAPLTAASTAALRGNQTSGVSFALPANTSVGLIQWSRNNDAANLRAKKDAGAVSSIAQNAAGLTIPGNFFIGAVSNGQVTPGPANFSAREIPFAYASGPLSDAEMASINTIWNAYGVAVGAI